MGERRPTVERDTVESEFVQSITELLALGRRSQFPKYRCAYREEKCMFGVAMFKTVLMIVLLQTPQE